MPLAMRGFPTSFPLGDTRDGQIPAVKLLFILIYLFADAKPFLIEGL